MIAKEPVSAVEFAVAVSNGHVVRLNLFLSEAGHPLLGQRDCTAKLPAETFEINVGSRRMADRKAKLAEFERYLDTVEHGENCPPDFFFRASGRESQHSAEGEFHQIRYREIFPRRLHRGCQIPALPTLRHVPPHPTQSPFHPLSP